MKSIEQKLKFDAQAFAQEPSQQLQDNIFDVINQSNVVRPAKANKGLWKIIPAVFAFGLMTMVVFHFSSYQLNQLPQDVKPVVTIEAVDNVVDSIEFILTNPIIKEQQDLISDLNHIESMISLM